jgi:hypothetical protein
MLLGVVAALAAGLAVFATGSHGPSLAPPAPDLAIAALGQRPLDWAAGKASGLKAARGGRAKHHTTAKATYRSARVQRRTVIVEQVRYVTAPAQSPVTASSTPSSGSTAPSSPQGSSASSNPAAGSVNQPAFGANGALGPGTSPDG